MTGPFIFPREAYFGRILPKNKIYGHAAPGTKVKDLFVREVEKITWLYKLSPETTNLKPSRSVQEIQILQISLKQGSAHPDVLRTIDKAIPSPILFILSYADKIRYTAAYKRPSEADKSKSVLSGYFESEWLSGDAPGSQLPVSLNLQGLYQSLLTPLIPLPARKGESLDKLVHRTEQLRSQEREADRLTGRMQKEKHYKRKVQLHAELQQVKANIELLKK